MTGKEKTIIWLICIVSAIGLFFTAWKIGDVSNLPVNARLFSWQVTNSECLKQEHKDPLYIFLPGDACAETHGIASNLNSVGFSVFVGFLIPLLLPLLTWLYFVKKGKSSG